ncbi:hypothetical protein EU524_01705 [Candidatus Thorarchaeota archaeon]|nr:MAG: hypothetical protein EU524_01705 [Candidatus Thorarchaeota archaeon]
MSDFYPISPLIGITNTSYAAQAGVMDERWAARVVRGKKIIAEKTMNELNLDSLVGIVYGHIRIEGLSRHAVAMCAGRLMQFARRYQQSGISPDFEVPDLVREGETPLKASSGTGSSEATPASTMETEQPEEAFDFPKLGSVPSIERIVDEDLWRGSSEGRAIALAEMAIYSSSLPEGHIEAIFEHAAQMLIRLWSANGDSRQLIRRFAGLIQSCSSESQIPRTGSDRQTIETGTCHLLELMREIDPEGDLLPHGYPCAYHELLARKVSDLTGVDIMVNTSSTGCVVTFRVE